MWTQILLIGSMEVPTMLLTVTMIQWEQRQMLHNTTDHAECNKHLKQVPSALSWQYPELLSTVFLLVKIKISCSDWMRKRTGQK